MTNAKKAITILISIIIWLLIWELGACAINQVAFFAGVPETFKALFNLIVTQDFWITVFSSMLRIVFGLVLGVAIGILLSIICSKSKLLNTFFSLGMSVIKSTPVASIIMILWIFIGSTNVASAIALFMVAPIIWQNLMDGYRAVSREFSEVADIFELSKIKRFRILTFPTLLRYFIPAILTSVGLAWKSGIAAEIITVAKHSIGYNIKLNKDYFNSDYMLAWTLIVIIISLIFEYGIKFLIRRFNASGPHN